MPERVLLTGFGPFGKEKINPSGRAVKQLNGHSILGMKIVGVELPVIFGDANRALTREIDAVKPRVLINTGVAPGRAEISLERVAINVMDAPTGDNSGKKPKDAPIIRNAPVAYFSTLPFRAILKDLNKAGIPAVISNTAGTHLCNCAMYAGLHHVTKKRLSIPSGFIHVPQTPDQVVQRRSMPSMSLQTIVEALELAVRRTILTSRDKQP